MRNFPKNSVLVAEGDTGDSLFVVLRGSARVFSAHDSNGREITYARVGPGDYFGEMALDGGPRSATVSALEATDCAVVSLADLRQHLQSHPDFALNLIARLQKSAGNARETARRLAMMDVYQRLRMVLEGPDARVLRQATGSGARMTHHEIAALVGASREMVCRLLNDLQKGGYIAMRTRDITVLEKLPERW